MNTFFDSYSTDITEEAENLLVCRIRDKKIESTHLKELRHAFEKM